MCPIYILYCKLKLSVNQEELNVFRIPHPFKYRKLYSMILQKIPDKFIPHLFINFTYLTNIGMKL
jgi:hypothetical protein